MEKVSDWGANHRRQGVHRPAQGKITACVAALKRDHGLVPSLSVVLVGDDEASQVYVRNKGRQTEEAGMISATHRLAAETLEGELLDLIAGLKADKTIHGILV